MSDAFTLVENLRNRGIADERVLEAIASVDRARFVPPESAAFAWDDTALPIGAGQTISQPYIVALMTEALGLAGGEAVLEVGTGSGYQAAVLSRLAAKVVTIERLPELQETARQALAAPGFENIVFRTGDGTLGSADDGPYDGILVTAAAPDVPPALYSQLADDGRLVLPVGTEHEQDLVLITKTVRGPTRQVLCACRFVPLIGEQGWPA